MPCEKALTAKERKQNERQCHLLLLNDTSPVVKTDAKFSPQPLDRDRLDSMIGDFSEAIKLENLVVY